VNKAQTLKMACLLCAVLLQVLTSGAQPVTNVAAGAYHSLFLKGDGSLWAMGYNYFGELGNGTYNNTNRPEQIVPSNVTAIAAGAYHSLILKSDGSLWAMGFNEDGELGDGTYNNTNRPEMIMASNVTAIAAGAYHSLFLKSDGSLWAMGLNNSGQLGDGTYNSTNRPEMIEASNVTAIAAGGNAGLEASHSLFIKSDGSLWAMGFNELGQLGDGTYSPNAPHSGINQPEQIEASNVTAIAAGADHSLFIKSDGSLWAMGYNYFGQLGDGTYNNTNRPEMIVPSNVTAIAAGEYQSLFLKSNGSLWAMGENYSGQLGDGTYNETNQPEQIVTGNVTAIATGGDDGNGTGQSLFIKSDGSLWAMGYNYFGQLGDGTYGSAFPYSTNRPEQIVAAYNQISIQLLSGGNASLSFVGIAGAKYALDRSSSLSPANWIPQATNPTVGVGALVFTSTPDSTTNNFWRIRSVQ
jgi:alpha-tubulin suppressor-like RCC1 family protein